MNPLLPKKYFIPDVEARVMPDGRLYMYGSQDLSGNPEYCSKEYRVFSTDDPKLENWVEHGISFENHAEHPGIPWSPDTVLYAPDVIYRDGRYYLYICGENNFEGVAVSACPEGPFLNAKVLEGADGKSIDPSVFVDDDGQAYYFWGQFRLMGAKLNSDMVSLDLSSLNTCVLTEMEHGFHEGASIRKRNGKYYMVYTDVSRGKATCMSYAMSDSPLGPYKRCGVIVDNTYCDPSTWNNHGSIEEFNGQWYVFYHRSSQNSNTSRRVCAEPIFFNEDGTINEVEMTSQGASGPICGFEEIDASIACRVKGNVYIAPDPNHPFDDEDVNEILINGGGGNWIEDWAEYRYINLEEGTAGWCVRAAGYGKISVMVEDYGIAGMIEINSEQMEEYSGEFSDRVSGIKAVWLLIDGSEMRIDAFRFKKE